MPRTYIKKNIRCKFDPENMKKAILEVKRGVPIRTAAAKFDVPASTLGKHYKDPEKKLGAGRKKEISEEDEAALAKYLEVCAIHGEGLTRQEMLELVKEFLDHSQIKTRWIDNKPGEDWFCLFFKRHSHLRIRKGEQLSNQRVRGADPFAVHRFYKDVKKLYKKHKITEDNAGLIYNCDESSFSHDPDEVRVIAKKGTKRVSKNVAGSGKTNTTVLACGAADGTKMPPFIIFSGTYVWNTWIPKDDYPGTAYTAQKKGWMEGSIFANWFAQVFLKNIPSKEDCNGKKVILFFDGVSFHINYAIVKMAYDNNVILVKLPPNLTHFMQPLDKTVFKPLKGAWNTLMIQWNRSHPGIPLPKEEFSRYIKTLWEENFHPRLLRSGFLSTGLFPVNETKFPEEAYDPIKLQRFRAEQTAKPRKNMTGTSSIVSTPTSTQSTPTTPLNLHVTTLASSTLENATIPTCVDQATPTFRSETTAKADSTDIETEKFLANPLPDKNQPGCSSCPDGTQSPSTFENFIRFKLTENVIKSKPKIIGKRKKISEHKGEILTSKTVMERIRKSEEQKKKEGTRKMKGKELLKKRKTEVDTSDSKSLKASSRPTTKRNTLKRKVCLSDSSNSSDSSREDEMCTMSTDEEDLEVGLISSSDDDIPEEFDPKDVNPKLELYYAVYYDVQWYIGRVIDFPDEGLCKIKFLKKELQGYDWPRHEDIQVVHEKFVFYGPVNLKGNGPFHITQGEISKIRLIYKKIKKDFKAYQDN